MDMGADAVEPKAAVGADPFLPDAWSRGQKAAAVLCAIAGLAAYYGAHAWDAWPVPTPFGADEDNVLLGARQFMHDGVIPTTRSPVGGTELPLGPLFPMWVGLGLAAAGGDPHGAWVWLCVALGAGTLLAGALLVRATGPRIGIPALAALIADPQLYAELGWPFYYLHQALPLLIALAAGLVGMNTRGALGWWYLAVVAGGLALPMHAMCWMVLPVVVTVAVASRRALGARHLWMGLALFVVVGWPFFSLIPRIIDPEEWQRFLHNRTEWGVLREGGASGAFGSIAAWVAMRVPFAQLTVPLAVLACAEQLLWSRRPLASTVTAIVALVWGTCFVWPLAVSTHRLHDHYLFPTGVALALGVGVLTARITPDRGAASRALPLLVAGLLLGRVGMAPSAWTMREVPSPWSSWQVLGPAFDALAELGVAAEDVSGGARRVHGTPCAWQDLLWCGGTRWLSATRRVGVSRDVDVNLGVEVDGSVGAEVLDRCVSWSQDDAGGVRVRSTCDPLTVAHVHAVLRVRADDEQAWSGVMRAAGWEVLFCVAGDPQQRLCALHRAVAPDGTATPEWGIPFVDGDTLLDVFGSARIWDAARFGLTQGGLAPSLP